MNKMKSIKAALLTFLLLTISVSSLTAEDDKNDPDLLNKVVKISSQNKDAAEQQLQSKDLSSLIVLLRFQYELGRHERKYGHTRDFPAVDYQAWKDNKAAVEEVIEGAVASAMLNAPISFYKRLKKSDLRMVESLLYRKYKDQADWVVPFVRVMRQLIEVQSIDTEQERLNSYLWVLFTGAAIFSLLLAVVLFRQRKIEGEILRSKQ